jgi:glycosidase
LQGIRHKLDYLQSLGVNALYLNPVFDSPSSHKYGAAYYHHIDCNFGPDPEGDRKIIALEDPADPATWQWTAADRLFLQLIQEIHSRGMHLIIDGVFNHVGLTFWAFQDVIKHREKSPYFEWFVIEGSPLEDLSVNTDFQELPELYAKDYGPLRYKGWVTDLPTFRQDSLGPVEPVRQHLRAVIQRWMDPNQDGNPEDGIDGWRLDVAERIQIKFWTLFGSWVREINPDAYLTGEVWWEDWWQGKMYNAAPWLTNNRFDAVMNYRFGDAMFAYFINKKDKIASSKLDKRLEEVRNEYPPESLFVLQNVLGSHDSERFASALVNPGRIIDHANNTWYNREFDIRKPNQQERDIQRAILTFQFAYIGAPYIYYGDEAGMWGADDPDCRKPMVWPELDYEPEKAHFCDHLPDCEGSRPVDSVYFDQDLFRYYQTLCHLRMKNPVLQSGAYKTILVDDERGLFGFERTLDGDRIIAIFNSTDRDWRNWTDFIPGFDPNRFKLLISSKPLSGFSSLPGHSGLIFKEQS